MKTGTALSLRSEPASCQAGRRRDEFVATIAHELRSPLAALAGALEAWPLVADDRALLDDLRQLMLRQVRQLARLSEDLLDVPRLAQGKLAIFRQSLDLRSVVEDALAQSRPGFERRGQTLDVSLPETPLWVCGDMVRLVQVVANLLQNAAKYTQPGGRIRAHAALEEGLAVVRVQDNGRGIPEPMLASIFELFVQGDRRTGRDEEGFGIGLALVKAIVESHEGSVTVRSEGPGRGSEFIVRLPALS
jgi:signal transduction histidine kinase